MDRKHSLKRTNRLLQAISPFPVVFSEELYCRRVKNQGLFRKGLKEVSDDNFKFDEKFS